MTNSNKIPFTVVRRFVDQFLDHLEQGTGLLLVGDMGAGKSHLACAALTEVIRSGYHGAFVSVADYLAALKPGYQGEDIDVTNLATIDLLVLDDVGASRVTEWSVGALAELLASRYDDQRPTILTTNSTDLAAYVGDRTMDRFDEMMLTARLAGASYRPRVADDESLRDASWTIPEPPRDFESRRCSSGRMRTTRLRMGERGPEPLS